MSSALVVLFDETVRVFDSTVTIVGAGATALARAQSDADQSPLGRIDPGFVV